MKIAVVGCGAVGGFYGAKLARAGEEVHFLARSDYEVIRRQGVRIRSVAGDFTVRPKVARAPEEIGVSDLVVIGLKTTANAQFAQLLQPLVGSATAVLTLQNGLGNEELLAELFNVTQIMGGLCFVCLNRVAPGVIQHLDHGRIVLGEFQRWPEPRTHDLATLFRKAGVPCDVTDDLERAHWEKLIWNIPFNGLGVAATAGLRAFREGVWDTAENGPCLTTDRLLGNPEWAALVRALMFEVVAAAQGLGLKVSDSLPDIQIERTRTMGPYKASTLLDFEQGKPMELESLFFEPLRRARKGGVAVPHLESLCRVLKEIEVRQGQESVSTGATAASQSNAI